MNAVVIVGWTLGLAYVILRLIEIEAGRASRAESLALWMTLAAIVIIGMGLAGICDEIRRLRQ